MRAKSKKQYLGDGVYAWCDGWHVVVEADNENGSNRIYLDTSVLAALNAFSERAFSPSEEVDHEERQATTD